MGQKSLLLHHLCALPGFLHLLQLSPVGGRGLRYLAAGKRGKSQVRELATYSTSGEAEIRVDRSWRAHRGKSSNAREAPPSHGGFCYFQIQLCFKVTSILPKFQKLFQKVQWPGLRTIHLVEPQTQESCLCLELQAGLPIASSEEAGRLPPTLHLAQFAFRELPPVLFSLSRQTSDSLELLGLSPGPSHQKHTALSDEAFWEAGNAWQA